MKCPYCGSEEFDKLQPSDGDMFALAEIDSKKHIISSTKALAVEVYGCAKCNGIFLKSNFTYIKD